MTIGSRGPLPGTEHTLFRGYGPFVAFVALILAMALLAPTIAPEREVTSTGTPSGAPAANLRSSGTGGVPQERRMPEGPAMAAILRSPATEGCCS